MDSLAVRFLGLIRFSHTLFALPFALAAATLAWNRQGFDPLTLVGIVVCLAMARAAAMAFNRLADRHIDAANPRTKDRHIPAGQLTTTQVSWFVVLTSVGFVLGTLLFVPQGNWYPLGFCLPVLGWLLGYSYAKRFTSLAHYWLGLALACAPVGAWVAIRGHAIWAELAIPTLFAVVVAFWVAGFDIIYACQDEDFDRRSGLQSIPARLGTKGGLRLAAFSHLVMVVAMALLPFAAPELGIVYWAGWALVAVLLVAEHLLVRPGDLRRVNLSFFWINIAISLGLWIVIALQVVWNQLKST